MPLKGEIKRRRKGRGLTQVQLAKASGVPRARLSQYESEALVPTEEDLERISKVLGVFIAWGQSPSAEVLKKMYCDQGMSLKDIGSHFGRDSVTVRRWLDKHKIRTEPKLFGSSFTEVSDRDELFKMYWEEGQTIRDMSEHFGVSDSAIMNWLMQAGIERRATGGPPSCNLTNANQLRDLYLRQDLSTKEIADKFNVSRGTVLNWFRHFGITQKSRADPMKHANFGGCDELSKGYLEEKKSLQELAKEYKVSQGTIKRWLIACGIERRGGASSFDKLSSLEELTQLYCVQYMSLRQIGEHYGRSTSTIRNWLIRCRIELRKKGGGSCFQMQSSVEELTQFYWVQNMSLRQIGEHYGRDASTIRQWLMLCDLVPVSNRASGYVNVTDREELHQMYWTEGQSLQEIGDHFGRSHVTIAKWMTECGIERRQTNGGKRGSSSVTRSDHGVKK